MPKTVIAILSACMLCLHVSFCTAQTPAVDGIKLQLSHANNNTQKLQCLFALCRQFYSLNTNASYNYAVCADSLAHLNTDALIQKQAEFFVTRALINKGMRDTAIGLADEGITWLKKNNKDTKLLIEYIFLKGSGLIRSARYKDAINTFLDGLKYADATNDTLLQAKTMWGIGWVYMELGQHRDAMNWFQKSLQATENPAITANFSVLYDNMAATYDNLGKIDSALIFAKKGVNLSRQIQALAYLANAYFIEGTIYADGRHYANAENDFISALAIRQKIGDMYYTVSDMAEFASFYSQTGQPQKGIALAKQGIDTALKYHITAKLELLQMALAENYKVAKDYPSYSKTLESLMALKDSTYQKNRADAITEMETKYETQKQELTIIQQKYALESERYFIYGISGLTLLLTLISMVEIRNRKRKQQLKIKEIMLENERATVLAISNAKEQERKRIIADLHDDVGGGLSTIRMVSDLIAGQDDETNKLKQYALKISGITKDVTRQMNTIVWALNTENDTLQNLSEYIREYGYSFFENSTVKFKSNLPDTAGSIELSGLERKNLFLCVKEALNNAYKHASAANVTVTIAYAGNLLSIAVHDDGKGISGTNPFGNGLKNMQKRMDEIKGAVSFLPGMGTTVLLQLQHA